MNKQVLRIFGFLFSGILFAACGKQAAIKHQQEISFSSLKPVNDSFCELEYAKLFTVRKYADSKENIYSIITVKGEGNYILVPEAGTIPSQLSSDITILKKPLSKTYLVSSSVMDLLSKIDAVENLKFSGVQKKDWFIKAAAEAMENGKLQFAGKYSKPDYDLLVSGDCNLAIENTMIYHKPEVREKLEELGIPVLVEHSNYEEEPFGRLEWIKLYGLLFDKEKEAEQYFRNQLVQLEDILKQKNTGKTVLFFYINSNGAVNVRKAGDYVSKMIELAGGNYALAALFGEEENAFSSMNIQFEEFYASGLNADIMIYNGTIDGNVKSKKDLLAKNQLLGDFAAWKNGNVYCTEKNFFQETTGIAEFIKDLNVIFNDRNSEFTYIKKLE